MYVCITISSQKIVVKAPNSHFINNTFQNYLSLPPKLLHVNRWNKVLKSHSLLIQCIYGHRITQQMIERLGSSWWVYHIQWYCFSICSLPICLWLFNWLFEFDDGFLFIWFRFSNICYIDAWVDCPSTLTSLETGGPTPRGPIRTDRRDQQQGGCT